MTIEITNETDFAPIKELDYIKLAQLVLNDQKVDLDVDINIVFVDEKTSAIMHQEWMGLEGPTDVLSFPVDEIRPGYIIGGKNGKIRDSQELVDATLGDIVICPSYAQKQCQNSGHTTHEEMLLLTIHGILHLLGYDHEELNEKKEMFDLQKRLLFTFLGTQIEGMPE